MSDSFKSGCNNTSKCESVQYFREKNLFDFKGGFAFLKNCPNVKRITTFDRVVNNNEVVSFKSLSEIDFLSDF